MANLRWKIGDIVDLEYFLNGYEPSDADRDIYLNRIEPLLAADKSGKKRSPAFVIRQWLESERISVREKLGSNMVLPGDAYDEIHQWLCWILMIAGIMTGSGMAFSLLTYKGTEPLNVSVFLGVLVGTQLLLLAFLLLILLTGMFRFMRHKSLVYSFLGSLLSKAIMIVKDAAMKKLPGTRRDRLMAAIGLAKGKKTVYGTLFYWPLFMMAQLFGMGFNIGILSATLLKVIGADIAFGWQSTVPLSSEMVFEIVRMIAIPWSLFIHPDMAHPSLAQIEGSRMILKDGIWHLATSDLVSWWPFLFLTVLFYGFLPRLTLFLIAFVGKNISLRRLDFAHSPCDRLLRRMETPKVSMKSEISDMRQRQPRTEISVSEPLSKISAETPETIALIPEEIFGQCGELEQLVSRNLGNFRITSKLGIGADNMTDIEAIASRGNVNVMLLQEAWQPPIKEILLFLEHIRNLIGKKSVIVVVLIGKPKPDTIFTPVKTQDYEIWRGKINSLADPYLSVERLVSE